MATGTTAAEVALPLWGVNDLAGAGYTEALGGCFMRFLLVLLQLTHDFAPQLFFLVGCRSQHHQHGIAFHQGLLLNNRDIL